MNHENRRLCSVTALDNPVGSGLPPENGGNPRRPMGMGVGAHSACDIRHARRDARHKRAEHHPQFLSQMPE